VAFVIRIVITASAHGSIFSGPDRAELYRELAYLSAPVEREGRMIRPQYVLIAEYQREGQAGKLDLLGVFDRIHAATVPAQHGNESGASSTV
jgi:hypothetical protein